MNYFDLFGETPHEVNNVYLSNADWNEKRNALAASILAREAAALMAGRPVQSPQLVEAALEAAGWTMAEIGIMPESTREGVA